MDIALISLLGDIVPNYKEGVIGLGCIDVVNMHTYAIVSQNGNIITSNWSWDSSEKIDHDILHTLELTDFQISGLSSNDNETNNLFIQALLKSNADIIWKNIQNIPKKNFLNYMVPIDKIYKNLYEILY